jgi:hypothetical protein
MEAKEGAIKFSESVGADGDELLKHACELGLEGIGPIAQAGQATG